MYDWLVGEGLGIAVHSLRAVGVQHVKALLDEARTRGMALHLHLEEQQKVVCNIV